MPNMSRIVLTALSAALILTSCAAPNEATTTEPGSQTSTTEFPTDIDTIPGDDEPEAVETPEEIPAGKIGDSFTITTDTGEATLVLAKVREIRPGEYDSPAKRGRYLEFTVAVQATSGAFDINPYDFALVDQEGQEYDATCCVGNAGNDLPARTLRAGQKAKGVVLYDGPKGRVQFAYRGGGFGTEDVVVWNLR